MGSKNSLLENVMQRYKRLKPIHNISSPLNKSNHTAYVCIQPYFHEYQPTENVNISIGIYDSLSFNLLIDSTVYCYTVQWLSHSGTKRTNCVVNLKGRLINLRSIKDNQDRR